MKYANKAQLRNIKTMGYVMLYMIMGH